MGKRLLWSTVLVVFAATAWVTASDAKQKEPPKKKLVIKTCKKKKPPVTFDHPAHVKFMKKNKMKCVVCHHLVKKKPADKDKCTDCHQKAQGKLGTCTDKSRKKNPFHVMCIGCHKKQKAKNSDTKAPTKCKQCHEKK